MPVTITKSQRGQLATDGYFITDVVFDEATLEPIRKEFIRLWHEDIAKAKSTGEKLAMDWAQYRPHMSQLAQRSETCKNFYCHPIFAELCSQLLGPDADMVWDQAIVKAPMPTDAKSNPSAWDNVFAWHQDLWYGLKGMLDVFHEKEYFASDNAVTCWCAITRTVVDNGTLWVLPGRHKEGLFHHNMHEARQEWQAQIDTSYKIPVVMHAGQILVFNKYLPHSSGTNISSETRMAYQLGYAKPGLFKQESHTNLVPLMRNNFSVGKSG